MNVPATIHTHPGSEYVKAGMCIIIPLGPRVNRGRFLHFYNNTKKRAGARREMYAQLPKTSGPTSD